MSRRLPRTLMAAVCAAFLIGGPTTAAFAAPANSTSPAAATSIQGESDIRQWMTDNGISKATQDSLIKKLASGKRLDVSAGVKPVSITTRLVNGVKLERSVYPDGSVGVVETQQPVEKASGGVTTLGIEGCTRTSGSGYAAYQNCTVTAYNPIVTAAFKANYQIIQGGYDKITYVGGPNIIIRGGSFANKELKINRGTESVNGPAAATLNFDTTLYSGVGAWTSILTLTVSKDNASVINNL